MSKIFTNEVKTGFLVILCVGILVGLTVMAGNFAVFDETYKIKAIFTNVAGVEANAPVRLGGVEVGKVDSIKFNYKKTGGMNILIDMTLERKAKLREGALAKVATLGLMGEKYIELKSDEKKLKEILEHGAQKARAVAKETLNEVYNLVGFKY